MDVGALRAGPGVSRHLRGCLHALPGVALAIDGGGIDLENPRGAGNIAVTQFYGAESGVPFYLPQRTYMRLNGVRGGRGLVSVRGGGHTALPRPSFGKRRWQYVGGDGLAVKEDHDLADYVFKLAHVSRP